MAIHTLRAVQRIPVTIDQAWNYFSDPAKLPEITPASMSFQIISTHQGERMYPGQIIEYYVRPVAGIRLYWMTEITQVKEKEFFVDEQRYGPYAMWHHQHHFKPVEGGIEMTDLVHYKNPFWIFGEMANSFLVRPKLRDIFGFRFHQVNARLGEWPGQLPEIKIS